MHILLFCSGLAAGVLITWIYALSVARQKLDEQVRNHPVVADLRSHGEQLSIELKTTREEKEKMIAELAALRQELNSYRNESIIQYS